MCDGGAGLRYLWFDLFFHRKVRKGRKDFEALIYIFAAAHGF
jgi:hypothetical protein